MDAANLALVWGVVLVCSLVQSLFGVGLLLFGTPLLLLLDVSFRDTLWLLLPASLTVSVLQVLLGGRIDRASARAVGKFALPSLVVGVLVSLLGVRATQLDMLVAAVLVASALLRLVASAATTVQRLAARYEPLMLCLTGVVHGLSNMGGSLLTAYAAARHADKYATRQTIAVAYALFAMTQLAVLSAVEGIHVGGTTVLMMLTAGIVFLAIGRAAFGLLTNPVFSTMLTIFMLVMALVLIVKRTGVLAASIPDVRAAT